MAESSDGIFKNPIILFLILVLLALAGGFAANFYLVNQDQQQTMVSGKTVADLKVTAQELAKHANGASQGNVALFPALADAKNRFETLLGHLRNGNPLS